MADRGRFWCVVWVLAVLCRIAESATFHATLPPKPEKFKHLEGCYVQELNRVIDFGERVSAPGECYAIECSRNFLHYYSCGVVGTEDPKCYITDEDPSQPYPLCCKTVKCDINNAL